MNSTTSSSQSQSPENPDALLLTWDDVYTGSYGTSLFLILVLTATFAEGILAVRSVPVKIAFWTSVFSSIVRLTVGYAISTVPGYDYANYNMPLGLVDSIYLMILDAFFFLHLAKTLRSQNKVLLPSGKVDFGSLSFEVAQIIRLIVFLVLEAMACYMATTLESYSATVQITLIVGSCTRPFLAMTDMGRARGIGRHIVRLESKLEHKAEEKRRSQQQQPQQADEKGEIKASGVLGLVTEV
ncbi:hypothetical protein HDU90_003149 [Geranomyces variabilis]|nr:hypothetical protein HDU90_003149 [Geranomyces variabilis]